MKLKEWNALDESVRAKLASVVFAVEGPEKVEEMSKVWHHNLDEDHKKLMKAVTVKEDGYKVTVLL